MSILEPLHPRLVHFPVALLATGSLLALVYLLGWRRPALPAAVWLMLFLGWLGIFPAVVSGLVDRNTAPDDPAVLAVMNPHIAAGFGLLILYGLLLYERLRDPGRAGSAASPGLAAGIAAGWAGAVDGGGLAGGQVGVRSGRRGAVVAAVLVCSANGV
ncbi:MAG: DUF2231 domain-containing protein [Anaerolineae bacterium]